MNLDPPLLRRFVVEPRTGRYLTTLGEWTYNEAEAMAFDDISSILRKCATYHVVDASIVLRFQSGDRFDIKFPLPQQLNQRQNSIPKGSAQKKELASGPRYDGSSAGPPSQGIHCRATRTMNEPPSTASRKHFRQREKERPATN